MPADAQAQLLAERATGLGGSDIHHLWSLKPWGCRRKLWYQKRHAITGDNPPDHPLHDVPEFERGRILEDIVADLYADASGHDICFVGVSRHKDHDCLIVHVDRLLVKEGEEEASGVLEIKVLGRESFHRVKRSGLPEAYILQLQHGMLVSGMEWGAFGCFWADGWQLLHWEVQRDEMICESILEEGPKFWATVENGPIPEPLPEIDARCGRCEWRTTCRGAAMLEACSKEPADALVQLPELAPLVAAYDEARAIVSEAEEHKDSCGDALRAALGDTTAFEVPGYRAYFRPQTTMRWDGKGLDAILKAFPLPLGHDLWTLLEWSTGVWKWVKRIHEQKRPSVSRPLRVYPT